MTRWNHFAGTAIVPTIARLVLALAFITIGLHKIVGEAEFTAEQATTLRDELGVDLEEVRAETVAYRTWQSAEQPDDPDDPQADPANEEAKAPPQERPAEPVEDDAESEAEQAVEEAADAIEDAAERVQDEAAGELIEVPGDDGGTRYRGQAVLGLALLLHNNDMPSPVLLAWLAALTEFGGGILILIGLFSRVWGLGLAIVMAMAFYLTTMERYFTTGPFEVAAQPDHVLYNTVFSQLGLGTLALLIFLAGPGPLSLDRLIFRPRKDEVVQEKPRRIERPKNETDGQAQA